MSSTTATQSSSDLDTTNQIKEQRSDHRLFALLIGINTYNKRSRIFTSDRRSHVSSLGPPNQPVFTNLRGAVADADHFYNYLTTDLGVPEKQITLLSDDKATRVEIIKAFLSLSEEKEIHAGDSIVIFYAGHGAQARPPKRLLNAAGCPEYIELLVPYDYDEIPGKQEYMGIPDYTLATLLTKIAMNKGDNITVVFDCCYSVSSLRGTSTPATIDSEPITRSGPELDYHIPDDLDEDIWGGMRRMTVFPRFRHSDAASYVLFSACASFELAKEKGGQGYFTSALLTLLREQGSHALPCSQIILRLKKIDGQSPQCEGRHIDRSIFHGFSSSHTKRFFNVRALAPPASRSGNPPNESPQFVLDAGSAHGFSAGDEITVYKSQSHDDQNNPSGVFVVDELMSSKSILKVPHGHPLFDLLCNPAPALLTKPAKRTKHHFQLYIDSDLDSVVRLNLASLIKQLNLPGTVVITSDRQNAHVSLSIENDENLRLDVIDEDLISRKLECSYHLVDADIEQEELARIFKDLAHYYWHLKHSPSGSQLQLALFFYKLERELTTPNLHPIDEAVNLYNSETRIVMLDTDVYLETSSPSRYGLMVTNNSPWDLFPALFYFDNTNFTISPRYQPPLSKQKDNSPLKTGTSMTIGYGMGAGGSVPPFAFSLSPERVSDGQNMNIGFFKLILSAYPIDLRGITQQVPVFDRSRATGRFTPRIGPPPSWTSFTIMVVQRLRA